MVELVTNDEMRNLLSEVGVISFSDHDGDGLENETVIGPCLQYATAFIGGRLVSRYALESLENSPVVREFANVVACRTLCRRRGNPIPESLEAEYQSIIEKDGILDDILSGKVQLVDDEGELIRRISFAPAMSNFIVDRRYRDEKIRVRRNASTPVQSKLERDFADTPWEVPHGS